MKKDYLESLQTQGTPLYRYYCYRLRKCAKLRKLPFRISALYSIGKRNSEGREHEIRIGALDLEREKRGALCAAFNCEL